MQPGSASIAVAMNNFWKNEFDIKKTKKTGIDTNNFCTKTKKVSRETLNVVLKNLKLQKFHVKHNEYVKPQKC